MKSWLFAHSQVALYTVMLGDRYSPPSPHSSPHSSPPGGLLFYLKGGHMQGLPALPHEKRGVWREGEGGRGSHILVFH